MKKGDLSMSVIIGAAVALLILVLLSVLILRAGGGLNQGTSCYANEGAYCIPDNSNCADEPGNYISQPGAVCPTDEKCCIPFGEQ